MIKILKETFLILNKNMWLLFLFMTVSFVAIIYFSTLRSATNSLPQMIIGIITLLLIVIAGVAGTFNSLRTTIDSEVKNEELQSYELLKGFPKGVGEYFLSAFGITILYLLITSAVFLGTIVIGKNLIGDFSFTPQQLTNAMQSVEALNEFQKNIPIEDLVKLSKWRLLYTLISSFLTFFLIYWLPETFYKTKNSLIALFKSLQKVFTNLGKTFILFFTVLIVNMFVSITISVIIMFPILTFLAYLLYFYGLIFIFMLIFNYYRYNFMNINEAVVVMPETAINETKDEEKPNESEEA